MKKIVAALIVSMMAGSLVAQLQPVQYEEMMAKLERVREAFDSAMWAPNLRDAELRTKEGKRCDSLNWPVNDSGCRSIAMAAGVIMLRESKANGDILTREGAKGK